MKRRAVVRLVVSGCLAVAWGAGWLGADETQNQGPVVQLDTFKARVPAAWKPEKPAGPQHLFQFKLPRHKDDKEDAEFIAFRRYLGNPEAMPERHKKLFLPPKGKSIDDVATVTPVLVGNLPEASYLDVSGTYKFNPDPTDPASKVQLKENYRMLSIYLEGNQDQYHLRLVGPAKTVGLYKTGFDHWLKALK